MSSLFSQAWYRVAQIKPELRDHIIVHRHYYNDEAWYILQDQSLGQYHRFNKVGYRVIGLLDGKTTVETIWDKLNESLGDDAPTQDEIIDILSKLNALNLLKSDVNPNEAELIHRSKQVKHQKIKKQIFNPLSIQFPLVDPDKFLNKTLKYVNWMFSRWMFAVWFVCVILAGLLAGMHWDELTNNFSDRTLSAQNILMLWLLYPIIKLIHELGHAYSVKKWGGEVHDMGIIFMAMTPFPYVDASSSCIFKEKSKRIFVSAAGIIVETFLAAIAMFIWLNVESGWVKSICFNIMLIGGLSTILFNGNPLLRYDGYYMLMDWMGIPNLATTAKNYFNYLFQVYLLGCDKEKKPAIPNKHALFLFLYAILAFFYRIFVLLVIIIFISTEYFVLGMLLATWLAFTLFIIPTIQKLKLLFTHAKFREKRLRTLTVSSAIISVMLAVFIIPLPQYGLTHGVVWLPEEALVRAQTEGFVHSVESNVTGHVQKGDPLIQLRNPDLTFKTTVLKAKHLELSANLNKYRLDDKIQLQVTQKEIEKLNSEINLNQENINNLLVKAPQTGNMVFSQHEDIIGRFVKQGELVAYILGSTKPVIRTLIPQEDYGLFNRDYAIVEIKSIFDTKQNWLVNIKHVFPNATNQLPSKVLGKQGGGQIELDTSESSGMVSLKKYYQLELGLPEGANIDYIGSRVYVRIYYGHFSIAEKMYRKIRQLFIRRFNV